MVEGLTHRQIVEEVFGILVRSIVEGDCYVALAFAIRNPNTPVENAAQMGPRYAGCVGAHRFLVAIASRTVVYLAVGRCAVVCSDTTPTNNTAAKTETTTTDTKATTRRPTQSANTHKTLRLRSVSTALCPWPR